MTIGNILSGFDTTGVYPINRNVILSRCAPFSEDSPVVESSLTFIPMCSPMPSMQAIPICRSVPSTQQTSPIYSSVPSTQQTSPSYSLFLLLNKLVPAIVMFLPVHNQFSQIVIWLLLSIDSHQRMGLHIQMKI